jgi:hypothetical protein
LRAGVRVVVASGGVFQLSVIGLHGDIGGVDESIAKSCMDVSDR